MANVLGEDYTNCCEPLSGDDPMGQDPKYEDAFTQLKAEIANIDAGTTEWKNAQKLAVEVLTTLAKDLNAAAYLSVALLQQHQFAGLADGIGILRHLVENHWQGLHPRQEKARKFTFEWLANRLPLFISTHEPKADEIPLLESIAADLKAFQDSASEQAKKYKPSLGEVQRALGRKIAALQPSDDTNPEAAPPSASEEAAAEKPAAASSPAPTPPPSANAPELPKETLDANAGSTAIRGRLRELIPLLRQADPQSLQPYRMMRSLKWDDLAKPPAADAGSGKTQIDSPKAQKRKTLETLLENQKWQTLLEQSEGAFQEGNGTYWLDLQFYSASALEELNPRAAALVRDELRQLLERLPGIPQLSFRDESPFADQQTRQWIEESVVKMDVNVVGGGGTAAEESVFSEDDLAEAKRLFSKKKSVEAFELLQAGVRRASNNRLAFRARLNAAQLCLQANHLPWAKSLLEDLGQEMEGFSFELWEPETAVEVYHLLALCYGRLLNATKSDDAKDALANAMAEIQGRLVRLDLPSVAKIEQALGNKEDTWKGGIGRLLRFS